MLGSGSAGYTNFIRSFKASKLTRTLTGVAELLIFHPVDTIAKRLMSNQAKV
jgi:hypothetical protein